MKKLKLAALSLIAVFAVAPVHAQAFTNLNFQQANPVVDPGGPLYPYNVTAASALPAWTVYFGTVQQSDVLQNLFSVGTAAVAIFTPDYPAAGPNQGFGTIDGNYTVLLQAGNLPESSTKVSASIAQTGVVPLTAQSLEFMTYSPPPITDFSVSFNGNNLSPVVLATVPLGDNANYTLFGVNISPYEGQTGTLEFSALFSDLGAVSLELENPAFSTTAIAPEPGIVALTSLGALLFGARKWFARRG